MTNMTMAIPDELHQIVKKHSEIKWSEIARKAMWEQAKKLELMDAITKKSKLNEKGIMEIDEKVKAGLLKRYLNANNC
jgi:hypothetical protein